MGHRILIIDDEASIRASLQGALEDEGHHVQSCESGSAGLAELERSLPDLVLLDIWMPGMDGLSVLTQIHQRYPRLPVVMMSGHGTIETAVKATKLGAFDFIEKPLSLERVFLAIQHATQTARLKDENTALRSQLGRDHELVGSSPPLESLRDRIRKVAPTTGSVLITGENGAGKEIIARTLHLMSPRFSGPFIEVNCAAIPEELIESELFGHEKGAFTGATQNRRGKFDLADGGTLFLDEIGDMSSKTQAKILRVLQDQRFHRVGGNVDIQVDVRIIAATNKDLRQEIERGHFREDLFFRLNVVPLHVQPLRERLSDIEPLSHHFLNSLYARYGRSPRKLSPNALEALRSYRWPGNVRELKNLMERLVILESSQPTPQIEAGEILALFDTGSGDSGLSSDANEADPAQSAALQNTSLREAREVFEREFILRVLKENNGNVTRTSQALGLERTYLHRKLKAYGVEGGSETSRT